VFLPIGDTPNPERFRPWLTWGLIGANILIYLLFNVPLSFRPVDPHDPEVWLYLQISRILEQPPLVRQELLAGLSATDLFLFSHGYKPALPELSDLFTSLFLHGGLLHLAGNMLFLWIYGDNVEHRLGRLGFLLAYLATGVLATLTFSLLARGSAVPLVGASGAISGVLGLYFLLFPRNRVKIFVFLFPLLVDVWLLPARFVLGFYLVVDNLLPVFFGADSSVAYGAHIGGFLGGLVLAWGGERLGWRAPWRREEIRLGAGPRAASIPPLRNAWLADVRQALARGAHGEALLLLRALDGPPLARHAPHEAEQLALFLDSQGHSIAASQLLRRRLLAASSEERAPLLLALGLLRLQQQQPTAAYQHLLDVFDQRPDAATATRARAALDRIRVYRGWG